MAAAAWAGDTSVAAWAGDTSAAAWAGDTSAAGWGADIWVPAWAARTSVGRRGPATSGAEWVGGWAVIASAVIASAVAAGGSRTIVASGASASATPGTMMITATISAGRPIGFVPGDCVSSSEGRLAPPEYEPERVGRF